MAKIDELIRIRSELVRFMLSEFFGTFLLVFIAHSTGAAYGFASQGHDKVAKLHGATFGVGIAALIALTASMPVSGGHINPAITLAVATMGHFPWSRVIPYIVAQYAGGFAAGAMVYITFHEPIQLELRAAPANSTLGLEQTAHLFCSAPAAHASAWGSFVGSFWGTAVFLLGIAAILDQMSNMKPPKWYWPFGVSLVLMISLAAFGHNGGPSVNPAADLAPRIFASLAGWGKVLWKAQGGKYWAIAGLAGPHLGAIFGLWFYRVCISAHYPEQPPARAVELERLNKA
ncbi:Aquaporin-10 [Halotydeus destructor]|nr:Aquaporin-10 [Halotydeus destructor]